MTLAWTINSGRCKNLDAMRLLLAVSVIVSHAWPLALGPGTAEPLQAVTGRSLGGWAVLLFFFLSGLLVTASAERRSARAFWAARARRIFPGLGAALLVTLALALSSGARVDLQDALTWVLRAGTLVSIEHRIDGAFAANPYREVVNGPLWSLAHEVMAYALCFGMVALGALRRPLVLPLALGVAALASLMADLLPGRLSVFAPLFFAFVLGMAAHAVRHHLILSPRAALCVAPLAVCGMDLLAIGAICYLALTLALRAPRVCLPADYSYGLYIYGWPVAQMIVHVSPGISPVALAVASVFATLPLALASWHLVERPSLPTRPVVA